MQWTPEQAQNTELVKEYLLIWEDAKHTILTGKDLKYYMPNEYPVEMQTHTESSASRNMQWIELPSGCENYRCFHFIIVFCLFIVIS